MYKIQIKDLGALYARIAEIMELFLPVRAGDSTVFSRWTEDVVDIDFDTLKVSKSPKEFFLPQYEVLYKSTVTTTPSGQTDIPLAPEPLATRPFALFGVRACDMAGIDVLDNVFICPPTDYFYKARRDMAYIITLSCPFAAPTCFCTAFGVDPSHPGGDVSAWIEGEEMYWKSLTENGDILIESLSDLLVATQYEPKPIEQPIGFSLEHLKQDELMEIFNSPAWDELHQTCIACGACTFICPTCQCYDISDFGGGETIRSRCWDSCMYSDFTLMAHGNPRQTQKERFRQRFMHKLMYHPANFDGQWGCVGCGRCVNKCPAGLNIVKVIKNLGVYAHA